MEHIAQTKTENFSLSKTMAKTRVTKRVITIPDVSSGDEEESKDEDSADDEKYICSACKQGRPSVDEVTVTTRDGKLSKYQVCEFCIPRMILNNTHFQLQPMSECRSCSSDDAHVPEWRIHFKFQEKNRQQFQRMTYTNLPADVYTGVCRTSPTYSRFASMLKSLDSKSAPITINEDIDEKTYPCYFCPYGQAIMNKVFVTNRDGKSKSYNICNRCLPPRIYSKPKSKLQEQPVAICGLCASREVVHVPEWRFNYEFHEKSRLMYHRDHFPKNIYEGVCSTDKLDQQFTRFLKDFQVANGQCVLCNQMTTHYCSSQGDTDVVYICKQCFERSKKRKLD